MEVGHLALILTNLQWKNSNCLSIISITTKPKSFRYRAGQQWTPYCLKPETEEQPVPKIFQSVHANKIQNHKKFLCIHPVLCCHAFSRKKK